MKMYISIMMHFLKWLIFRFWNWEWITKIIVVKTFKSKILYIPRYSVKWFTSVHVIYYLCNLLKFGKGNSNETPTSNIIYFLSTLMNIFLYNIYIYFYTHIRNCMCFMFSENLWWKLQLFKICSWYNRLLLVWSYETLKQKKMIKI